MGYFQDLSKRTCKGCIDLDLCTQLHPTYKSEYLISAYYVLSTAKYYSKYKKQKTWRCLLRLERVELYGKKNNNNN